MSQGPAHAASRPRRGIVHAQKPDAGQEQRNLAQWRAQPLCRERLTYWVLKDLKDAWGFKAAARTWHIATTGRDAAVVGPYKDHTPLTIPVRPLGPVPGTAGAAANLFDLAQVLAWLAKERRDVQEQLDRREAIQALMCPLAA